MLRSRPRRRELDPGGCGGADARVPRVEAHPDELAVHLHVVDAAVRLERGPQARLVEAGNEEVLVRVLDAEQLVPDGAADDVGVEPERTDVAADLGGHGRLGSDAQRCAIASISTSAPDGSLATSNVERAGARSPTCLA